MPAYFGSWVGATTRDDFKKEISNLKILGIEFRQNILFRLGEEIAGRSNLGKEISNGYEKNKLYVDLAESEIKKSPGVLADKMNTLGFMTYVFEDYQIVLSQSIPPDRIIKVLPQGNEFGRVLKRQKATTIKMKEIT